MYLGRVQTVLFRSLFFSATCNDHARTNVVEAIEKKHEIRSHVTGGYDYDLTYIQYNTTSSNDLAFDRSVKMENLPVH